MITIYRHMIKKIMTSAKTIQIKLSLLIDKKISSRDIACKIRSMITRKLLFTQMYLKCHSSHPRILLFSLIPINFNDCSLWDLVARKFATTIYKSTRHCEKQAKFYKIKLI